MGLEDKWYKLIDALDAKGIPIRAIIDPLENAGIPSMPVVIGVLVIILALVGFMLLPAGKATLTVKVVSNGEAIENAQVAALFDGEELAKVETDEEGVATFELPVGKEFTIEVMKEACEKAQELVTLTGASSIEIDIICKKAPPVAGCIELAKDLDQAVLATPDGGFPRGCVLKTYDSAYNPVDMGWQISGNKLYMSYSDQNCPERGQIVVIDCNDYTYTATMEQALQEIHDTGSITLKSVQPKPDEYVTPQADVVYTFNVIVTAGGEPLPGIQVSAVRRTGELLSLEYSNVVTTTQTDLDGVARLVIPKNVEFYIKAEDNQYNKYRTYISNVKQIATSDKTITIVMQEGFPTTITVENEKDNTRIPNAEVSIIDDGAIVQYMLTGSDGTATTVLEKKTYDIEIRKPNYMMVSDTIVGGEPAEFKLTPLDDSNSGFIVVTAYNKEGIGEPLGGIKLSLMGSDGKEYSSCVTPSSGQCQFGRIPVGKYYIQTEDGQSSDVITLEPGETENVRMEIAPEYKTVQVKTNVVVDGTKNRMKGVQVDVYDVTYAKNFPELIFSGTSGENRQIEFQVPKNSEIYLKGQYTADDGTQYGPLVSAPFTVRNDMIGDDAFDLDLTKMTQTATLSAPSSVVQGQDFVATISLHLPYFDPQTHETFRSAEVEFWVGDQGSVSDIEASPIIIKSVRPKDYSLEDPTVSGPLLATEFSYSTPLSYEEAGSISAAKYFKIDITKYNKPVIFNIPIPLHVRTAVLTPDTELHYRAKWVTNDGKVFTTQPDNAWVHVPITIDTTQTQGWHYIDTHPDFYLYSAWLSTDKAGQHVVDGGTFADGSTFYLQIRAKAKRDASSYGIEITSSKGYSYPITYSGAIVRTDGSVQKIEEPESIADTTRIDPVADNPKLANFYKLEADDELQLAVKMKVYKEGEPTTTLRPEYNDWLVLFNDQSGFVLPYTVLEIPESQQTPISNVLGRVYTASYMFEEGRYFDHTKYTVPSITVPEQGEIKGRRFATVVEFENNNDFDKQINFALVDEHAVEQPWAKFYELTLPVEIDSANTFTVQKQGIVSGSIMLDDDASPDDYEMQIWKYNETSEMYDINANAYYKGDFTIANHRFAFSWIPEETGEYRIEVAVRLYDEEKNQSLNDEEKNQSLNYSDYQIAHVVALPNIQITQITVSPMTPHEGDTIYVNATVRNAGTETVPILDYDSDGKNELEPIVTITAIPTSLVSFPDEWDYLPPLNPGESTVVGLVLNNTNIGYVELTVCANYYLWSNGHLNFSGATIIDDNVEGTNDMDCKSIILNIEAVEKAEGSCQDCPVSDCSELVQPCNYNGICETNDRWADEDANNCPSDCPCDNDGVCDPGEDKRWCPNDCHLGDGICDLATEAGTTDCYCGDGVCDPATENATTCPSDCGCGNGICQGTIGENYTSCPQDCAGTCDKNGTCEWWAGESYTACTYIDETAGVVTGNVTDNCTCGNGLCEPNGNPPENYSTCPQDCSPCNGDGVCDAGESWFGCMYRDENGSIQNTYDCTCGDYCCNASAGETIDNCYKDCGFGDNSCLSSLGENWHTGLSNPCMEFDESLCGAGQSRILGECVCNYNGTCEPSAGEDHFNCPGDCNGPDCSGGNANEQVCESVEGCEWAIVPGFTTTRACFPDIAGDCKSQTDERLCRMDPDCEWISDIIDIGVDSITLRNSKGEQTDTFTYGIGDTVSIEAVIKNYNTEKYTKQNVSVYSIVLDEQGAPYGPPQWLGMAKIDKDSAVRTTDFGTLNYSVNKLGAGTKTVWVCALFNYTSSISRIPNRFIQDVGSHANCKSATFEIVPQEEEETGYAGEEYTPITAEMLGYTSESGPHFGKLKNATNIRELVENDPMKAAEALAAVPRNDEPTMVRARWNALTIPANGKKWVAAVGKGIFVTGDSDFTKQTSTMEAYMWDYGEDEPTTTWEGGTFKHGWVDYDMILQGFDSEGNEALDTTTKVLVLSIIKRDADHPTGQVMGYGAVHDEKGRNNVVYISGDALNFDSDDIPAGYVSTCTNESCEMWLKNFAEQPYFEFVLPTKEGGALKPGTITVKAIGYEFGPFTRNFSVGGILFDGITEPVTWNFTEAYGNEEHPQMNQTIKVYNYWPEPVTFEKPYFSPSWVVRNYGIDINVKAIYNEFGREIPIEEGATEWEIPGKPADVSSAPYAEIVIKGAPDMEKCSGYYKPSLWFDFTSPEFRRAFFFELDCPGAAEKVTTPGEYEVYRYRNAPEDIDRGVEAPCSIEDGVVRVCDAEQFTMAVLKDALNAGPNTEYRYAVGNEKITATTMEKIRQELGFAGFSAIYPIGEFENTANKELWVRGTDIGCGIVTVKFEPNNEDVVIEPSTDRSISLADGSAPVILPIKPSTDRDVLRRSPTDKRVLSVSSTNRCLSWCDEGNYSFVIGAMNLDKDMRAELGDYVNYYAFKQDEGYDITPFINAIDAAKVKGFINVDSRDIFGYSEDIVSDGSQNYDERGFGIKYRDYYIEELVADKYNYITDSIDKSKGVFGYYTLKKGPGAIGVDIEIGLVYTDRYYNVHPEELNVYRQALASELVRYWTYNNSTDISENKEQVFNITTETVGVKPVADAGLDLVTQAGQTVTLDASDSYDPDGTITKYIWNISQTTRIEAEEYDVRGSAKIIGDNAASGKLKIRLSSNALIDDFEDGNTDGWRTYEIDCNSGNTGCTSTTVSSDAVQSGSIQGRYVFKTDYEFSHKANEFLEIVDTLSTPIPDAATRIGFWFKADHKDNMLRIRYVDANGEIWQPSLKIDWTGWKWVEFPLDGTNPGGGNAGHWGGDGIVERPLKFRSIIFDDTLEGGSPDWGEQTDTHNPVTGSVYFDEVTMIGTIGVTYKIITTGNPKPSMSMKVKELSGPTLLKVNVDGQEVANKTVTKSNEWQTIEFGKLPVALADGEHHIGITTNNTIFIDYIDLDTEVTTTESESEQTQYTIPSRGTFKAELTVIDNDGMKSDPNDKMIYATTMADLDIEQASVKGHSELLDVSLKIKNGGASGGRGVIAFYTGEGSCENVTNKGQMLYAVSTGWIDANQEKTLELTGAVPYTATHAVLMGSGVQGIKCSPLYANIFMNDNPKDLATPRWLGGNDLNDGLNKWLYVDTDKITGDSAALWVYGKCVQGEPVISGRFRCYKDMKHWKWMGKSYANAKGCCKSKSSGGICPDNSVCELNVSGIDYYSTEDINQVIKNKGKIEDKGRAPYEDVNYLVVNDNPDQNITFHWCTVFGYDRTPRWVSFDIPKDWLVTGENKFRFYDTGAYTRNNWYVAFDRTKHDNPSTGYCSDCWMWGVDAGYSSYDDSAIIQAKEGTRTNPQRGFVRYWKDHIHDGQEAYIRLTDGPGQIKQKSLEERVPKKTASKKDVFVCRYEPQGQGGQQRGGSGGSQCESVPKKVGSISFSVEKDSQGEERVVLTWGPVDCAFDYKVYRKPDKDGNNNFGQVASTGTARSVDIFSDPAKTYTYKVKACNNVGCGDFSDEVVYQGTSGTKQTCEEYAEEKKAILQPDGFVYHECRDIDTTDWEGKVSTINGIIVKYKDECEKDVAGDCSGDKPYCCYPLPAETCTNVGELVSGDPTKCCVDYGYGTEGKGAVAYCNSYNNGKQCGKYVCSSGKWIIQTGGAGQVT
ncbi:MAG: hypothetical protein J7K68_00345 [Candidatus Diapherotrites archaeon]|nr:hypothetical protein [Candidatus Diapherotrites archaeon]